MLGNLRQVFIFSLNPVRCRVEGCSLLLLPSPAKASAGPALPWILPSEETAAQLLSTANCPDPPPPPGGADPPALAWHRHFVCAPCCVSPTWVGLVLRWWEWRARKMPVFLWEGRLWRLSSLNAALKVASEECTLFKDHSLVVFLWIL